MIKPLDVRIPEIIKEREGRYHAAVLPEEELTFVMDTLFELFKMRPDKGNARRVYEAVESLALTGRLEMADHYATRFRNEIGYKLLRMRIQ